MLAFIVKLKVPASDPVLGGGFQMHPGGEVDIRGTYTALAVLSLTHTHTHPPRTYTHPFRAERRAVSDVSRLPSLT